jgi:hypothetical protein
MNDTGWPSHSGVIKNKYWTIYNRLMVFAQNRQNIEDTFYVRHHIVPDCFFINRKRNGQPGWLPGNPDESNNIVILTEREHYISHQLLTKFLFGIAFIKMVYALDMLLKTKMIDYRVPSRVYAQNIILVRTLKKGKPLGPQKKKRSPPSPESNEKRRQKLIGVHRPDRKGIVPYNKGLPMSDEQKEKLRGRRKPMSEEHKELRRGKRGPLKSPRKSYPRGPYKKKIKDTSEQDQN